MTDVKNLKSRRRTGPYATLDLTLPSSPANSFITDIGLWFVRERGNWLPTATWVSLLGVLDIPGPSARTALHRMTRAGYLERRAQNATPGYAMSRTWIDYIGQVAEDLFDLTTTDDRWALLTFSIPEAQRSDRHAIRTLLGRYGFAPLGNGVWIASAARLPEARVALEASGFADYVDIFEAKYEGFTKLSEFARRCWDIDGIAAKYRAFIRDVQRRLKREPAADSRTFADIILTSNTWRRINFSDPALPKAALPADWPRADATRLRDELVTRFLDPASNYVVSLHSDRITDGVAGRRAMASRSGRSY